MKLQLQTLLTLSAVLSAGTIMAAQNMSLSGQWRFQLDRADAGLTEKWFDRVLPDRISLPGGLTEQGIGDPITTKTAWIGGIVDKSWFTAPEYAAYRTPGNVKVPFWLQPELYYAGAAWFQRDFAIPKDWEGNRVVLYLEHPHWETRVWLDGRFVGTSDALATPHEYDLGQLANGNHTLTIRVDNRLIVDIGENSHSISDHTQGNWNGVVGRIELRAMPSVWIEDLQVYPQVASRTVRVKGAVGGATATDATLELGVRQVESRRVSAKVAADGTFEAVIDLGQDARMWDEFNPALQELTARIEGLPDSVRTVRFGLREITTDGTQFLVNGRKTFIRGTLDCCIYPKTGYPPTDVESWKRVIKTCKAHGLNLLRFHSWCPPEAAFIAADELGFYFQVEASSWANHDPRNIKADARATTLGDGNPVDTWIYAETDRILKYYGNHPSFILMPYGNEPGGKNQEQYLARYVNHYKALDSRRLWTSGAGWPQLPENQFHITPDPRIQVWGAGLKSRINAKAPETMTDYRDYIHQRSVPVISHEIGEWCVYPNFDEIKKYTGYLKPKNFEIFRDLLAAHHMGDLARQFLLASGKLQTLCYKEDIESALRTPGMGGFELLDLHDFPGQGTALVGVLDPFWESKGYVTPEEYSRFCNSVVPLARLPKRVFTSDERLTAEIEAANFGAGVLPQASAIWRLTGAGGKVLAKGKLPAKDMPVGNGISLGSLGIELNGIPAPQQCKLVVGLAGTKFENDWDIWIYPAASAVKAGDVLITARFDDEARNALVSGGKVLLTLPAKSVRNYDAAPVKLGFSSIFWNTAWTGRQAPTTLGILCDPKHPALAKFPTDYFSNWQWWYLIHRAGALRLDLLPAKTEPVVRVIDDWVTARPLGLIVEGKVGAGKIIICGFDLTDAALTDPVSFQMRESLVSYLGSEKCRPGTELSPGQITSLIHQP